MTDILGGRKSWNHGPPRPWTCSDCGTQVPDTPDLRPCPCGGAWTKGLHDKECPRAEYTEKTVEALQVALREVLAERDELCAQLAKVESVLVAADRLHEAYDAMLDGQDIGRLPAWQPLPVRRAGSWMACHRWKRNAMSELPLTDNLKTKATQLAHTCAVLEAERDSARAECLDDLFEYDRLREELGDAVDQARLFNRGALTWQEYDALLARWERIANA